MPNAMFCEILFLDQGKVCISLHRRNILSCRSKLLCLLWVHFVWSHRSCLCTHIRKIVWPKCCVLLFNEAIVREIGVHMSASTMLQRLYWSSKVDFTLEKLFTRNLIQFVCRVAIRRNISSSWVLEWLAILNKLVATLRCILILVWIKFHCLVSVEIRDVAIGVIAWKVWQLSSTLAPNILVVQGRFSE